MTFDDRTQMYHFHGSFRSSISTDEMTTAETSPRLPHLFPKKNSCSVSLWPDDIGKPYVETNPVFTPNAMIHLE